MKPILSAGALFFVALAAGLLFGRLAGTSAAADPEPKAEIPASLKTITSIGREGNGNPEAARAWKSLVAQGTPALLPILSAMDDDQLTAANWLRSAFEAVAEKALADGSLSKETLEKFIADKKKAGTARRLAYEWLVKLDRTAPDRLLPGMVQDPSAELRREAVERVIESAKKALDAKDEKAATQRYEQALAGAVDADQVDAISAALKKLGKTIDLQKQYGVVTQWYLVTPFDHRKGIGWDVPYPPEKGVDVTASYKGKDGAEAKWVDHATKDPKGVVDLNKLLGNLKGTIAYACAFVDSPEERLIELRCGSPNGLKVWLNGKEVFAREEYHHGGGLDQYAPRGTLKKGLNVILVKVCQNEQTEKWAQEWRFQMRLCEPVGAAVPFTSVKAPAKGDSK